MKPFKQFLLEMSVMDYDVFGFIGPNGKVYEGDDTGIPYNQPKSHKKVALDLGFSSEIDAIKAGYVRFLIIDGNAEFDAASPTQKPIIKRFISAGLYHKDVTRMVQIDFLSDPFNGKTFQTKSLALAWLNTP